MKNKRKSYKIKSKFRFTASVTTALVLLVFMTGTVLGFGDASSMTKYEPIQIEIQSGDSLWKIASEYGPSHEDTRKIVHEICSLNDITADNIYPGQIIYVPDYNK